MYLTSFHFRRRHSEVRSIEVQMDFRGQNINLSFSIENILRDDFPHPRKTNVVNTPKRAPCFDSWSNAAPVYRCYAVRYSPVVMKYQPSMNRVGGKIHQVNGDKKKHPENFEDDHLRCKGEAINNSDGKKCWFAYYS